MGTTGGTSEGTPNEVAQSETVLTNELRLHDYRNARMSVTFGDSDLDGGYSFLNIKYRSTTKEKVNYIVDREIFNIAGPHVLLLNDYKIWHEKNDGPNSGMNADMLDGKHAVEFKDRYGYHHFMHMFLPKTTDKKHWVKIATFTTRKIGKAPNFNTAGTPPYAGAFEFTGNGVEGVTSNDVVVPGGDNIYPEQALRALIAKDEASGFKANTPYMLDEHDPDLFHSTTMLTNGIYNGTLRACVSILKDDHPTTFDIHLGLFEDPLCTKTDAWEAVSKYFYVSLHDETLPFLNQTVNDWGAGIYADAKLNPAVWDESKVNVDTDDMNHETKDGSGTVQDGYTPDYPKFKRYDNWEDQMAYVGYGSNVYITSPSTAKSNALKAIKYSYNGNAEMALAAQITELEDLEERVSNSFESLDVSDQATIVTKDPTDKVSFNFSKTINKVGLTEYDTDGEESPAQSFHRHGRPQMKVDIADDSKMGNYNEPPLTMEDVHPYELDRKRKAFPANNAKDQGDSYQTYVDIMRLYHVASRTDVIDNVSVDSHIFELYMATDGKTEVRVQPYVSSACLLLNFEPTIQEGELPAKKFIRPKSIYDTRYASVHHRHYDYERRMWELAIEVEGLWKNFSKYVKLDQGKYNSGKVMMTDSKGKVFAADDNMERHCEPVSDRRMGDKVLITKIENIERNVDGLIMAAGANACIEESTITIDELAQLTGIGENIQQALNKIRKAINYIAERVAKLEEVVGEMQIALKGVSDSLGDFVKKKGDNMTGSLWIDYNGHGYNGTDGPKGPDGKETFSGLKFKGTNVNTRGGYVYGNAENAFVGFGVQQDITRDRGGDWVLACGRNVEGNNANPYESTAAVSFNGEAIRFGYGGRSDGGAFTESFLLNFADVFAMVYGQEPYEPYAAVDPSVKRPIRNYPTHS